MFPPLPSAYAGIACGMGWMREVGEFTNERCRFRALVSLSPVVGSIDEPQGPDTAPPSHWQRERRFGYVRTLESTIPDTPAALASQHAIAGETEIGCSPADWYEIALSYDMRIANRNGRVCFVKTLDLREGAQFSIKEPDLTDCGK